MTNGVIESVAIELDLDIFEYLVWKDAWGGDYLVESRKIMVSERSSDINIDISLRICSEKLLCLFSM